MTFWSKLGVEHSRSLSLVSFLKTGILCKLLSYCLDANVRLCSSFSYLHPIAMESSESSRLDVEKNKIESQIGTSFHSALKVKNWCFLSGIENSSHNCFIQGMNPGEKCR